MSEGDGVGRRGPKRKRHAVSLGNAVPPPVLRKEKHPRHRVGGNTDLYYDPVTGRKLTPEERAAAKAERRGGDGR